MSDDTYLMLVDGKVQAVDLGPMMRRHRAAHVEARADRIDPAAALFADPAFDLEKTYDVAEAAMPGADVNAASYIGLVLREVELNGGGEDRPRYAGPCTGMRFSQLAAGPGERHLVVGQLPGE